MTASSKSGDLEMGAAKKLGIILLIYLISGMIFCYMLSTGQISWYTDGWLQWVGVFFLPILYLWNILAPILGLNSIVFGMA